jgi:hypothetical protein
MHSAYRAAVDFDQFRITPEPRLFTVGEANALLADVEPLVAQMREAAASGRAAGEIVHAFARRVAESGGGRPDPTEAHAQRELGEAEPRLSEALRLLEELGVSVKDPTRGLLDFPSVRGGEVVELCWLHGEPGITHWHRIGEGFAGRKPLDEDVS